MASLAYMRSAQGADVAGSANKRFWAGMIGIEAALILVTLVLVFTASPLLGLAMFFMAAIGAVLGYKIARRRD